MSLTLRILLIIGSVLTCVYVLSRVRKSRMKAEDSIFWLLFSLLLVLLGAFPGIVTGLADLIGIQSPINLLYLIILFLLILKIFRQDQRIARQQARITALTQRYALDELEREENDEENPSKTEADKA